jgi:hypothetical protein
MPGETGVTVVTMLVCSFYFACEAAGAAGARHSLRPLLAESGRFFEITRAKMRGEIAKLLPQTTLFEILSVAECERAVRFARHTPRQRGIQYSAAVRLNH